MIPQLTTTGYVPAGRYLCDLEEIEKRFVDSYQNSSTRAGIWDEFQQFLGELQRIIPVCAIWIGGSFISEKNNPADIDLLLIVDSNKLEHLQLSDEDNKFLYACTKGHEIWKTLGISLRVDTYTVFWKAIPNGIPPESEEYYQARGYWDDFWQRYRSGSKTDTYVREDSFPRRGYLEVVINGYE